MIPAALIPCRKYVYASLYLTVLLSGGCGTAPSVPPAGTSTLPAAVSTASASQTDISSGSASGEEHPHIPGAHGGIIIPIGSDSYHAEAVIDADGKLRLLMLQKDESRVLEVERQPLKAYVKTPGDPSSTAVDLEVAPQDGDSPDKTSQFVGVLPEQLRGRPLDVTIPNLRIAGERFRIGFSTATAEHSDGMPAGVSPGKERELYLTAGGRYTAADITANGNTTPAEKFRGLVSKHDARPKVGDRLCPISGTKANSEFTWIIDGHPYQFCCPPCIDEFVRMAKEEPEELNPPDTYIKTN
ncbi:MAG: hypothetical protein ACKOEO_16865 [Planctomycetaceae bacterium]